HTYDVPAPATGTLTRLDAYAVGVAAWRLGAGRALRTDTVSPTAGVTWHAAPGEQVVAGAPLLTLHTDDETRIPRALDALRDAVAVDGPDDRLPLIIDRVDGSRSPG
ncbi:MAG TPA: thymidine phosphorylase, partial [Mycobacteriales bacterium]